MTQKEKDQLVGLLEQPSRWCREAEARDGEGEAVHYNDPEAVAWDIVGGMCSLFGWNRAVKLFMQTWRHITGNHPHYLAFGSEMHAMRCLQDFNDSPRTDYELVISRIRGLKVHT